MMATFRGVRLIVLNIITNKYISFLKYNDFLKMLSLFIVGIFLYQKVFFYDFVSYDDAIYIKALHHNISGGNLLYWAFTNIVNNNWSPVTLLSFAVDYKIYGLNAGGYHATSVFLHCINAILVFLILNIIFEEKNKAYFISLLFLIHPLNVETVTWISERKGVLSAFFSLWALYFYLKIPYSYFKKTFYILALMSFILALLSKAVFVTLPFIFILVDWYICKSKSIDFYISKSVYKTFLFFLISLLIGVITIRVHSASGAIVSEQINPLQYRLGNVTSSYIVYLKQLFYPFDLIVLYSYKIITGFMIFLNTVLITGIFYLVYINRRERKYLTFGIIWYTLLLLPVIGIVQSGYHAHADRYSYIPLIGIFIVTVYLLSELITKLNISTVIIKSTGVMLIFMMMFISWVQISTWKNTEFLFEHTLTVDRDNYAANTNLAVYYIHQGDISKGLTYYRRAKKVKPYYVNMYETVSLALLKKSKPDLAVNILFDFIKNDKMFVRAYIKIAQIRINQQQYSKSVNILLQAREIDSLKKIESEINYLLAYSYLKLNQKKLAINVLENSAKVGDFGDKIILMLNYINIAK